MSKHKPFELPPAPERETGTVKAWEQSVTIPTYHPHRPDKNPMFLEKRVYQGCSGRVYPLPFIDRIDTEPRDSQWRALHIENDYLRMMVLPEIGGRIHVGLDKTNNYDFFYRQNVIKPALVGLAGPWASGGVEFNWPQHHRPATFMPVETTIEKHPDGSQTIWCGDHDPMNRLKGMHGVCLQPGRSCLELKVRLYNRTPLVQTFLWWANVATHVHEAYQSFFPPDVHFVADHAKRAMSEFPLCAGLYYGVDYETRARLGVTSEDIPAHFVPDGSYAANDLSWYANIPVPTSYMALGSQQDFSGGYDHKRRAGLVHVANHHIAPGKKQWTWGNHEFGYAWDRNLTDDDGPYIELMAGVYTDNQPDFSFLAPGETKSFSQYWYPIREIGPAQAASIDVALAFSVSKGLVRTGICSTRSLPKSTIHIRRNGESLSAWCVDLLPDSAFSKEAPLPEGVKPEELEVSIRSREGRTLLKYRPIARRSEAQPEPATEPLLPDQITSIDELYITGMHLDQYRHASRQPEIYWREALRRDPSDARCNNALGLWHLRRGEFDQGERHFRTAIARLTHRNPNPYDGEPFYNLGLTLRYQERYEEAYSAFYKATWNFAWRAPAYLALAQEDARRRDWNSALDNVNFSLRHDSLQGNALSLRVIALQRLGHKEEATSALESALSIDPLNAWCRSLDGRPPRHDNQLLLDVAFDCGRCGLLSEAGAVLDKADFDRVDGTVPMVLYALANFLRQQGDHLSAQRYSARASRAPADYCFPSRIEELILLREASLSNPRDARAPFYLGNLLYDRRRYEEAILSWEQAAQLDPSFATVWRNLGIAYFNVRKNPEEAVGAYEKAWTCDKGDARVLYERDQLWKRLGFSTEKRLHELRSQEGPVKTRDDLAVEFATLLTQEGRHQEAASFLSSRKFQPWEGGEGLALSQHVRAYLGLGRAALKTGNASVALRLFETALDTPGNLGEAKHLLSNQSNIYYWCGVAALECGDPAEATKWWGLAANTRGDFQQMSVRTVSDKTFYTAMALKRLGRDAEAAALLQRILEYARTLSQTVPKIDYFATSLPTMLLFDDDLARRNRIDSLFLKAQVHLGLGDVDNARELVEEVHSLDPSHTASVDLINEFEITTARHSSTKISDHTVNS